MSYRSMIESFAIKMSPQYKVCGNLAAKAESFSIKRVCPGFTNSINAHCTIFSGLHDTNNRTRLIQFKIYFIPLF